MTHLHHIFDSLNIAYYFFIVIVIYNDNKVSTANGILYFKNEPTRHKILDILGDFMHCGKFIKGEFICKKSGHSLNRQLVEEILKCS